MTETASTPTKAKFARKSVQITYPNGDTNVFSSFKAAADATGHSNAVLLRLAATGEADENGDTYKLIDFVPKTKKKKGGYLIPFSDDLWSKIEAHAKESISTPEGIVIDIVREAFVAPGEESEAA